MFKNLKKKIEQGVAQSKAAVSGLTKGDDSFDRSGSSEYIGKPLAESTPQKDGNQVSSVFQDVNSPVVTDGQKFQGVSRVPIGQLVDIPLSEGFDSTHYETASERSSVQGDETPRGLRSRASSISSLTSDSSFFPSVSYSHSYYVPSDAESEIEETSVNLSAVSKEDLYAFVKRVERRAFKYKSKFMELAAAYKDMMQEREKLKMTMAQCQDRAFRRMSELREQIQLDQIAKRDLEENFRLLLDEKDEYMKILQLQVKLLKDGKEIPEELQAKLASKQAKAEAASPTAGGDNKGNISTNEEIELLKSKIKRQDGLLQKCKETITSYKEKVSQLSLDKQDLLGKLEMKSKANEKSADQAPDQVSKLQAQIQEARKVIEQLETDKETQIANVKQQVQEELAQLKEQIQTLTAENSSLKLKTEKFVDEVENLRKTNQEQLEKARSIMKQLKDEKQLAVELAEERIRHVEQSLKEKEKIISEISRDNTEAFSVSQLESDQNLNEKVQAAVEERDNYWNLKMAAQEAAQNDLLQCKDKEKSLALTLLQEELSQKLQEKDKEIRLAVEERELQKVTNVTSYNEQRDELLLKMEEVNAEKIELSNRLEKLQEDLESQVKELQKRLREGEVEHSRLVEELRSNHEAFLDNERSSLSEKAAGDLELVRQSHALEVQALVEKQEQSLQEFKSNTESQYMTQMEDLQGNLENLLTVTKEQLEEVRASHNQVQAKLADTEQLLTTAQMDLDSRKKEHDSQLEELYASINGKGDENEELRRVIEEIRSQLGDQAKELEDASLRLTQAQEETFRLREQVEATQGESKTEMEGLFLEREDLIQKNQALTAKESNTNGIIKNLEESNLELTSQSQILLEELRSVREELNTSLSSTRFLQREKLAVEEEFQRKLTHSQEEADQSKSQALRVLEEQLTLLREEHESLFSNAEISQTKIEKLEKRLEEVSKEKEIIESKGQELEVKVNQLQDVVQGLESQKSEVEVEKSSLEEKLTDLEMTIASLKASKEELNVQQETLAQQQAVEQQTSESRISDLILQTNRLNEKVGELVSELSAKNDENAALKSAADDSNNVVRSLEYQINQINVELQGRAEQNEHMDATLAAHLEQFEQFKIGAVEETKQLKESIDTLTEKLNQKQLECEELRNTFALEQDSLIKKHNEHISQLGEEMISTEQVLKEQLETKQAEFKDKVAKLKEELENKMQEKDTDFEDRMKELMSQKDLGIEDLNKNFDRLKEEQLRSLEEKHLTDVGELVTEWQVKCQRLDDEHRLKLDAARSQFQDQITDLQQKLDISLQESASHKNDCASIQSELESSRSQLKEVSQKYTEDIDALNVELNKKNDQLYKAMTDIETFQFDLMSERNLYEGLRLQKQSLEEQLQEKESKLESMVAEQEHLSCQVVKHAEKAEELQAQKNIISEELEKVVELHKKDVQEKEDLLVRTSSLSEQLETKENNLESLSKEIEHLRKQLAQQMEISEELQSLKNDLSKQLVDVIEDHNTNVEEKDTVLNDMCQKLQLLEVEHASVGEMLSVNLASIASETVAGSLRENIERLIAEKDALLHNLETNVSNVTALQEELQSLRGNSDKVVSDLMEKHAKEVELLKSDLTENHAKEVELLKSSYNSQISQLSSNYAELQSKRHHSETQLTELNEKFQDSVENYETRLEEERSKLERQETSLKEQINVLKQQLYEAQSQAEVSSNELQFSLQQKVKEGEEKLLTQLQSHQEEMETLKQETEQKAKDLKQKYIAKLREIQGQAKSSVEELDRSLQAEKATKEEISTELSKANSQIQQLVEDSGTLNQRIIHLEDTVRETTAQIGAKDDELQKLKSDLAAFDKNTETVLQESQLNLQQVTDKLKEAESKLTEKESDLHDLDQQLQEKLLLLEQKDSQILALQGKFQELEEAGVQEKEKHELVVQEKHTKCSVLENNLEETHKLLAESESAHAELKERVKSSMLDLEKVHGGQQQLQDELAQLSANKKQLESELLDTKTLLEKSLEEHALVTRELESRLHDQASQKEQDRQNLAAELAESKSLNENIKQNYETKLKELHEAHALELSELSSAIEAQSSTKVAEYKRKAEAFISQMKKQLQDEKAASFDKQQEKISQLEETILVLTKEVDELKQSKLTLIADNERILQTVKSELDAEVKLKQAVIEECYKKEQDSANTELELKQQIDLLLSERSTLLDKVSVIEKGGDDFKVQYAAEIEQLRSKNDQLQKDFEAMKSEKDEELADLEAKLAETVQKLQKERHAALEDQANEHSSKLKMLVKEMNSQLGVKDREFEATFREVLEKSERTEQDMMRKHHEDVNELRKEISERDERIQELHVEYKTKIQELELQSREAQAAFQKSAAAVEDSLSQQKVSPLSSHMGQSGEQSKSELDEITSRQGREWSAVPKPVVTAPVRQTLDASDPDFSLEMQDLELHNIDLQAQVSHLNGELSHFKVKERDLLKKIDKLERAGKGVGEYDDPAASIDGLYLNHSDSAIFREPTEFEYLKNILYEYMMGKETKTLAKVIATVVRFSEEQTRNVVARSDTKVI